MAGQSPIILTHFYCERMLLHRKVPFLHPHFFNWKIGRLEDLYPWLLSRHFPLPSHFFPQNENGLHFFYYLCSHLNTKDQL